MKTNRLSQAAGLVLGAVLALPAVGTAQEPRRLTQPDSIPIDLASALLATGGFAAEPQILVGAMPEWAMSKLSLPADAHVLGSSFLGTTVVAVVSVAQPPLAAMITAKSTLLAHGWKNPPPLPTSPIGGFRSAPPTPNTAPSTRASLCGDQQLLSASATTQHGGATIITYRLSTTTGYSICRPPDIGAALFVRPLWPTLYNPAGASEGAAAAECLAGNMLGGGAGPSALLVTPLTPDALLDHYGAQLADSGWKAAGDKGSFVGRTWTRPDSVGNTVETSVVIHTSAQNPRCREASMQVRTLRKP